MSHSDTQPPASDTGADRPQRLGFLLVDGYALMCYASVVEPFRAANTLAGRRLYDWRHVAVAGDQARASNGAAFHTQGQVGEEMDLDILFVCAGGNPAAFDHEGTFSWLRRLAQRGVRIGGVSGGPYILARAGLLDGYRCTIHWEHRPALVEEFPQLAVERSLYVIDRARLTCAGGIAGLDLAIEMIERDHGRALATAVGEWYIRTEARPGRGTQRMSPRERFGTGNPRILAALALMENRIEDPASRAELAAAAGTSIRQLERLFADHLSGTVARHYQAIRLERARLLLRQTSLPVTEVAMACGFVSPSHFSRSFRARFGHPPAASRGGRPATVESGGKSR